MDLALPRDARDNVLDPFCVRASVGKIFTVDAACMIQEHFHSYPLCRIAIGNSKVRKVPFKRCSELNPTLID